MYYYVLFVLKCRLNLMDLNGKKDLQRQFDAFKLFCETFQSFSWLESYLSTAFLEVPSRSLPERTLSVTTLKSIFGAAVLTQSSQFLLTNKVIDSKPQSILLSCKPIDRALRLVCTGNISLDYLPLNTIVIGSGKAE